MMPGQEANCDNFGIFFFVDLLDNNGMLSILMSTHNIQFFDKIRKFP